MKEVAYRLRDLSQTSATRESTKAPEKSKPKKVYPVRRTTVVCNPNANNVVYCAIKSLARERHEIKPTKEAGKVRTRIFGLALYGIPFAKGTPRTKLYPNNIIS